MSNSFGEIFRITSFGESHGQVVGILIDGCPAGLPLKEDDIQRELDKRRPAPGEGQTARSEEDRVSILSGVFRDRTTGAPITMLVRNKDTDSRSYEEMRSRPRPGHADYTYRVKYGGWSDYRGGGRSSGRITAGMVMAGAVAKKLLSLSGIEVLAHTVQIGGIKSGDVSPEDIRKNVYAGPLRCADPAAAQEMSALIRQVSAEGDSLGGIIEGLVLNLPAGLGEPLFDTLEGELAKALFAVPAVKGVEFGAGFSAAGKRGSENNDPFIIRNGRVEAETNHAGGILGGISSGMPLVVRAAIKPTPSISRTQKTVDLEKMENTEIEIRGRHDACIVPRAVIVVESMLAVTLCDFSLRAGIIPGVIQ